MPVDNMYTAEGSEKYVWIKGEMCEMYGGPAEVSTANTSSEVASSHTLQNTN